MSYEKSFTYVKLGNHVLSCGNKINKIRVANIITRKGNEPTKMSSTEASDVIDAFTVYTTVPKGGVSIPISTATTVMIPNQTRS